MEQKKYKNLEEAFAALSPELRAHSLRVEKYADLIFMELCAAEEYLGNTRSRVRLKLELRQEIGEAARYHDLGKVLVPAFYQWNSEAYSPEEQALYKKHCIDGANLTEQLVQNQPGITAAKVSMLAEAASGHHERWDGRGWPNQLDGEQIPILGRITAVADALDHRLMDTRTENPVDDAIDHLMYGSGTLYDPVIMGLLFEAKRKVEKIFSQYAAQSRAIPKATRIIRRKARRPFYLQYRPIISIGNQATAAVEADMCFRRGKDIIGFSQMAHLLREKKDAQELALMFLLEAADTARRLEVCKVGGGYLALNLPTGFLRRRGTATAIAKLMEDTDSDAGKLCLILTEADWDSDAFGLRENCEKLSRLGFRLMVSGVPLSRLDVGKLLERHITHCRLPVMENDALEAGSETLRAMKNAGITLLCDGLETYRRGELLSGMGVKYATGVLAGGYVSEDDFISGELALVRE